ncbi:MAG: hypothetical protein O7C70_06605 [Candidatus Dadabacteria bacterium]|jgi:hypothetical protein|nr:hypothetical protein [Candidatus Dadabacteria bacterium]
MNKLETDLLKILCSGSGQGNTNTNKLTEKILESNPDLEYNKAKIEIVETLRELNDSGEIRIMTLNWELGEEFLYLYENIID